MSGGNVLTITFTDVSAMDAHEDVQHLIAQFRQLGFPSFKNKIVEDDHSDTCITFFAERMPNTETVRKVLQEAEDALISREVLIETTESETLIIDL